MRASDPASVIRKLVPLNGTADDDKATEGDRPRINAGRDDFPALAPVCWHALEQHNTPPLLFVDSAGPIRLDPDPMTKDVRPVVLDDARFQHELGYAVHWFKTIKVGKTQIEVDSSPKLSLVRNLLASRSIPFPVLERIVRAPMFGADGSLETTPGYHAANRTYFLGGLELRPVSNTPSSVEVTEAIDLLVCDLFVDFPFVNDSDIAHAVGELILPFVRAMIAGPCPLHVHEAPAQGTGKDLLAEVMSVVVSGIEPTTLNYAEVSDEFVKRLVATLRKMPEHIVIPNVSCLFNNNDIADTISRGEYQGRLLGVSELLRLPARNVWTMTSNNAQLNPDMVRRSVRIRLDARMVRPETRTEFRHRSLKTWTREHRNDLVWACLTIVRHWIAAGMPPGTAPEAGTIGGFEDWIRIVGGVVTHAGFKDFLGDREVFIAQSDTASDADRAFVSEWWNRLGPQSTGVAGLYPIAIDDDVNLDISAHSARGERTKLGVALVRMRDRRYVVDKGTVVTVRESGEDHNRRLWKLEMEVSAND